jgi:hypothetical protein
VRALEDLQNQVRDPESRRYLAEAIRAYQAGALRSAIVAIWVSVALDLVAKIRELATQGEKAAISYIEGLDRAVQRGDIDQLVQVERNLLTISRDSFELIDAREQVELERLRLDRHVCAHPAFVKPEEVFDPTPELVRVHIATAVDSVLARVPSPGKKAIDRFRLEIDQDTFPQDPQILADYLRERFFERGKSSLRRGLAELIVKGSIDPPEGDLRRSNRCALAAHALDRIEPELLKAALMRVVRAREEGPGLSQVELVRFAGMLGDLSVSWQVLPTTSHHRVMAAIENASVAHLVDHGLFTRRLPEEYASVVRRRQEELSVADLQETVTQNPDLSYMEAAVKMLAESGSFRQAERNMERHILPVAHQMDVPDIRRVLDAFRDNRQIHFASKMPDLMLDFFHRTTQHYLGCYFDWLAVQEGVAALDTKGGYYSYPGLSKAIDDQVPF